MALICLVLASVALRLEGGTTFAIGGGFTKWIFWCVTLVTLPQLLLWFSFFGLPVPLSAGAIGTTWLEAIGSDVSTFVASFIVARLTIVVAAYFIVRAVAGRSARRISARIRFACDISVGDTGDGESHCQSRHREEQSGERGQNDVPKPTRQIHDSIRGAAHDAEVREGLVRRQCSPAV